MLRWGNGDATRDNEREEEQPVVHAPRRNGVRLPIHAHRDAILYSLEKFRTVVIVGETGCGKSTQIPQFLHGAGWTEGTRQICVTQPRRIAAVSVARRVSEEMGSVLGEKVGYCVRFEDVCGPKETTRIKFVTDGMLVREAMTDPLLSNYSVVMVDEAHERSLHTDILLGLLKKIMRKRPALRVIVASATIEAVRMKEFFETNRTGDKTLDTAVVMSIEGRMYPVDTFYLSSPTPDYIQCAVDAVLEIHRKEKEGDILVFMTGQEEIDTVVSLINEESGNMRIRPAFMRDVTAMPLYAGLPFEEQMRVFQPCPRGCRKVVVATNIAETSITIDGIVYVVDSGFIKMKYFDGDTGISGLSTTVTSKASARQRAGRAGRVCPGKCFRLYPEEYFLKMQDTMPPEIQRADITSMILQLKSLGIDDILHFDFFTPPPIENLSYSLELCYALGALDDDCKLTSPLGVQIAEFPVEPRMAKMILEGCKLGCGDDVVAIAAMLSVQNVFVVCRNKKLVEESRETFFAVEGDHLSYLNIFRAYSELSDMQAQSFCQEKMLNRRVLQKAVQIRNQLRKYCKAFNLELLRAAERQTIVRSIVSGFFSNAAARQADSSYRTLRSSSAMYLHPSSVLLDVPPQWVVFSDTDIAPKLYMRDVLSINPSLLQEVAPHYFSVK